MSSLTVGEFQRLANVTVYRDSNPELPAGSRAPRVWSPAKDDSEPMTAFRGTDYVIDGCAKVHARVSSSAETAQSRQILRRHAVQRFAEAAGYVPEWALGAGAEAALTDRMGITFEKI